MSSTWHDPALRGSKYDKVLVVAMTRESDRRMSFEDAVATALSAGSAEAWPSSRLMDTALPLTPDTIAAVAAATGAQAIVVTRVTNLSVEPVKFDAYTDVSARRKTGTAFQYDYIEKEQAAYMTTSYTTVLTTDVYAPRIDDQLVYTVVSSATGQETINDVINVLSEVIARRLRSDSVIR